MILVSLAQAPFQTTAWHSYQVVGCILQYLDISELSPQVFAQFGRTKFIARCLRYLTRGIPMGSTIFSTCYACLDLCMTSTIKRPCTTFWHGEMSDKSRLYLPINLYLFTHKGRIVGFMPFLRVLTLWNANRLIEDLNLGHHVHFLQYLPTPPSGQDMTQGRFLSGV